MQSAPSVRGPLVSRLTHENKPALNLCGVHKCQSATSSLLAMSSKQSGLLGYWPANHGASAGNRRYQKNSWRLGAPPPLFKRASETHILQLYTGFSYSGAALFDFQAQKHNVRNPAVACIQMTFFPSLLITDLRLQMKCVFQAMDGNFTHCQRSGGGRMLNQSVYETTLTFTKQELPVKLHSDECLQQRVTWLFASRSEDLNKTYLVHFY